MNKLLTALMVVLLTVVLVGCDTITRRNADNVSSTRIVHSEAGGVMSVFTGRVSSCMIVGAKDDEIDIKELEYDNSTDKCVARIGTGDTDDDE